MNRLVAGLISLLPMGCEVSGAILAHRYSFNAADDTTDSAGGNDGVLLNGATVDGTHLVLSGAGFGAGAASMGFTSTIDIGTNFGTTGVTIETWYTDEGSGTWAKVFTFGTNAVGAEIAFTNRRGGADLAPGLDRNGAKFLASYPQGSNTFIPENVEHHLVVTVADDGTTNLWVDGTKEIDSLATNPLSGVVTNTESIGATAWNDPGHLGRVNEFRIWSGVLTDAEVQENLAAGPNVIPIPGDSDSDGLPDTWEQRWFGSAASPQGPTGNPDNDGVTNLEEFQFNVQLDPTQPDTDGDGLQDGNELKVLLTNPLAADTDGDTLGDGAEVNTHHTDPLKRDTDGDGFADARELAEGTNPLDPNSFTRATLAHRYSFLADATDSVGGNHGIFFGDAHVENGELVLDGFEDRMDFTNIVGLGENFGTTGVSIETWYTDNGSGIWAKVFTFGSAAAGQELAYTNRRGGGQTSGIDRDGAKLLGFDVSQNEEHHLAITVSPDGNMNGYLDGEPLPTIVNVNTNDLANVTSTSEFLGESAWNDPEHLGTIDEFRIWRGELSATQTAGNFQLGPDVISSVPASFVITSVTYDAAANRTSLTWNSIAGKRYTVWVSENLIAWTKLPGDVVAAGAQTSFTDTTIPPGLPTRYYYVQEEP